MLGICLITLTFVSSVVYETVEEHVSADFELQKRTVKPYCNTVY